MINLKSILNDLLGAAIIIAALVVSAVVIKLIVFAVNKVRSRKQVGNVNVQERAAAHVYAKNELKLINVDEKTAALVMAIVSHESGIPLSELIFTSVKLV